MKFRAQVPKRGVLDFLCGGAAVTGFQQAAHAEQQHLLSENCDLALVGIVNVGCGASFESQDPACMK